jgi:hypothetical protein
MIRVTSSSFLTILSSAQRPTCLQAAHRQSHAAWQEEAVPDAVYISYVPERYYNDNIEQFENVSFELLDGPKVKRSWQRLLMRLVRVGR